MNSAQFTNHFDKRLRTSYDLASKEAMKNSAFTRWADVGDTTEYAEGFTSTEGVTTANWINAEQASLQNSQLTEGYAVTITSNEAGQILTIPYKQRIKAKDSTVLMAKIVERAKQQNIIGVLTFIEKTAHNLLNSAFTGGTATGGFSLNAPDGQPLISASHAYQSGQTFSNLLAASSLSLPQVAAAEKLAGQLVDGSGTQRPVNLDTVIVKKGSTAATEARKLFANLIQPTEVGNVNVYQGGLYTVIEVPWITSDTAYFFRDSSQMNSTFVNFIERPKLQEMITEKNLDYVYPVACSFKYGIRELPVDWIASAGA